MSRTRLDPDAPRRLADAVPPHWKGAPLGAPMSLRELAASGLDALGGDLPMPLLLVREDAVAHNIARMARFAADNDVLLAPHAKTTMSPQLLARQVEAGCWAVTAATPSHLHTLRRLGVQRILLANQLVEPVVIRWLADELADDPTFELICFVDTVDGVALLDRELRAAGAPRSIGVLLEVGAPNGRAGVRTLQQALTVARAADEAATLEPLGVACYEGLTAGLNGVDEMLASVDAYLDAVAEIADGLHDAGLLAERLMSAGGSAFFDRVLARFPRPDWRVVLRSGCYVTQDGGFYGEVSPLGDRGDDPAPLRDALELWGAVLSRPEPGVAVVGAGKRDAPYDDGLPRPVAWRSVDGARGGELPGAELTRLNDQHMTFPVPHDAGLAVGDLVRFAISHPCGAFDRWRVVPLVDAQRRIVGALHTQL